MSKGLYPGNFSIFHDGHASIVEKCLKIKDITKLHIIISNKERDGITPETSFDFIYSLYKNNPRVEVSISEDASPIKTCYGIVGNAAKGDFFMVSSDKGNDYDRVEQFVEAFSEHGRYYNPKVHVLNCPIKIDALCYKDRSDRYNETPISASVARRDVKLDNFENFKTNFQNIIEKYDISEKKIRTLFNKLRDEIKVDAVSESTLHRNIQSKYGNVLDYQELKEAFDFDNEEPDIDQEVANNLSSIKKSVLLNKILPVDKKVVSNIDLFVTFKNGNYINTDSEISKLSFNNFNFPKNSPEIITVTQVLIDECKKYALEGIAKFKDIAIKDMLGWRFDMPHIKFEGFFKKDEVIQCLKLIANFYTWYKEQIPGHMVSRFGTKYPGIFVKIIDGNDDYASYIQDLEFIEYYKDPNTEFGLVPVKYESFDFDSEEIRI